MEKFKLVFKNNPCVFYISPRTAPSGCEQVQLNGKTFWKREVSYDMAINTLRSFSRINKFHECRDLILAELEDTDDSWHLTMMDFGEWYKYL